MVLSRSDNFGPRERLHTHEVLQTKFELLQECFNGCTVPLSTAHNPHGRPTRQNQSAGSVRAKRCDCSAGSRRVILYLTPSEQKKQHGQRNKTCMFSTPSQITTTLRRIGKAIPALVDSSFPNKPSVRKLRASEQQQHTLVVLDPQGESRSVNNNEYWSSSILEANHCTMSVPRREGFRR